MSRRSGLKPYSQFRQPLASTGLYVLESSNLVAYYTFNTISLIMMIVFVMTIIVLCPLNNS